MFVYMDIPETINLISEVIPYEFKLDFLFATIRKQNV